MDAKSRVLAIGLVSSCVILLSVKLMGQHYYGFRISETFLGTRSHTSTDSNSTTSLGSSEALQFGRTKDLPELLAYDHLIANRHDMKPDVVQFDRISNDTEIACRHYDLPVKRPTMQLVLYEEHPPVDCSRERQWVFVDDEDRLIFLNSSRLNLKCTIAEIYRLDDCKLITLQNHTRTAKDPPYQLKYGDAVEVDCIDLYSGDRWADVLLGSNRAAFQATSEVRKNFKKFWEAETRNKPLPANILIWSFDSMARNDFIRTMPKSWSYMSEQMGGILMEGYNLLKGRTIWALSAIFYGKPYEQAIPWKYGGAVQYTDDVAGGPLTIFDKFRQNGFLTAFYEDEAISSTFHHSNHQGFQKPPADAFSRVYDFCRELLKGHSQCCCGNISCNTNVQNHFKNLWRNHANERKLFFAHQGTYSHHEGTSGLLGMIDHELAAFLEWANSKSNDTLIIIMTDHGQPIFGASRSWQAMLEMKMPLMYLVFPKWMDKVWPEAMANFRTNAKRLTTPADIGVSLASFLNFSSLNFGALPVKDQHGKYPVAMNLFQPTPKERTCRMAFIPTHFCACPLLSPLDTRSKLAHDMASHTLAVINDYLDSKLNEHRFHGNNTGRVTQKCAKWLVLGVEMASLVEFPETMEKKEDQQWDSYELVIKAYPGPSHFRTTVEHAGSGSGEFYTNMDVINRMDWYSTYSKCVDSLPELRMWCYCV